MPPYVPPSTVSADVSDILTYEAITRRESIAKNYNPVISSNSSLPMLQLKTHGDCTIVDPRACLSHYNSAPDLACLIFCHISKPYFDAMVRVGLIINKTRVVLRCTENDAYVYVIAQNPEPADRKGRRNVEELIDELKSTQGNCRPGVELLTLDYELLRPRTYHRKRTCDGTMLPLSSASTTTAILSGKKWAKKLIESKKMYECQRELHSEQKRNGVMLNCKTGMKKGKQEGRMHVPTLVIEGPWMLIPEVSVA